MITHYSTHTTQPNPTQTKPNQTNTRACQAQICEPHIPPHAAATHTHANAHACTSDFEQAFGDGGQRRARALGDLLHDLCDKDGNNGGNDGGDEEVHAKEKPCTYDGDGHEFRPERHAGDDDDVVHAAQNEPVCI